MKKINRICKILIVIILVSLQVLIIPMEASAMTHVLLETESSDGTVFNDVSGNNIFKEGHYLTPSIIAFKDGHREIAIMSSEDQKTWVRYAGFVVDSQLDNLDIKLVYLNNQYILFYREAGENIVYTSTDMSFWQLQTNDLNTMTDIQYDGSLYWILDSEGAIYKTVDFVNFTYITSFEKIEGQSLIAVDLLVAGNKILVSHYNTKWGQNNPHNGIQIYDRLQNTWSEVQGIENEKGLICDMVYINQQFVLVTSNIYLKSTPIQCFTSLDGVIWEANQAYTPMIRSLWPVAETDSGILLMIKKLSAQVSNLSNNKTPVPVAITMNGSSIDFNNYAVLYQGKVLVPIREFFQELGGSVEWKGEEQQVVCLLGSDLFVFDLDEKTCHKNGVLLQLATPAMMLNGKSMISIREISENLGFNVEWDARNYQVNLKNN